MFKNLRDRLTAFKDRLSKKVEEEVDAAPEEVEVETVGAAAPRPPSHGEVAPTPPVDDRRAARRAMRKARRGDGGAEEAAAAAGEAPVKPTEEAFTDSILGKMIRERKLDDLLDDLETILLESDVALPVAEEIKEALKGELVGRRLRRDVDMEDFVEEALQAAIRKVLAVEPVDLDAYIDSHPKPVVLMFVGVNGTGKTTAIARIAHRLKKRGLSVVLAAGDTFRAGAIEQIDLHAQRLGVKIIKHQAGSDPAAVAFDAV